MARSSRRFKPYLLISTVSSKNEAERIAKALVYQKLVACVNVIGNVKSIFRWHGKIDQVRELLLIVKTDSNHLKRVQQTIRKYHTYEIPEMIGWPISWGYKPYLRWLRDSIG